MSRPKSSLSKRLLALAAGMIALTQAHPLMQGRRAAAPAVRQPDHRHLLVVPVPDLDRGAQDLAVKSPRSRQPDLPVCLCGLRPGIAMGFWEPVRLADVSMKPWCFVNLGGLKLDPGFDIGFKLHGGAVGGRRRDPVLLEWHVHWYAYPLIYWMEIVADFLCLEAARSTSSTSPRSIRCGRTASSPRSSTLKPCCSPTRSRSLPAPPTACLRPPNCPRTSLFWCAGCQGSMYPLNGNVSATIGHVQASRLALSRFAYKLHRELVAWGTMGGKGLCGKYLMPVMRKQQYRFQATNPNPADQAGAMPARRSAPPPPFMSAGQVYPAIGEDMGYLVWRKRNCCAL
jgi:conjugal transfer pilus assembly protein TraU